MKEHKKTIVYDWPIRIFHWLFASLFLVAFIIANVVDDDSAIFSYHMLIGLTMVFILILRIVWGFIGTTYSRFSSFALNPKELMQYFKELLFTKTNRYLGHNPASSFAAIVMFICAIGLAASGVLMTSGNETDFFEESHELFANLLLITAVIHVGGIIFHHLKHKDSLWSSMINGRKKTLQGVDGIKKTKAMSGIVFLFLTILWVGYLSNQYESESQKLSILGIELSLGDDHTSKADKRKHENDD